MRTIFFSTTLKTNENKESPEGFFLGTNKNQKHRPYFLGHPVHRKPVVRQSVCRWQRPEPNDFNHQDHHWSMQCFVNDVQLETAIIATTDSPWRLSRRITLPNGSKRIPTPPHTAATPRGVQGGMAFPHLRLAPLLWPPFEFHRSKVRQKYFVQSMDN